MLFNTLEESTKNKPFETDVAKKLFAVLVVAGSVQIIVSVFWVNWLDLGLFFSWAQGLFKGFYNAYDGHIDSLDYPPGYFGFLWLVGALDHFVDLERISDNMPLVQVAIKFFPILFNLACGLLVYKIGHYFANARTGLTAAIVWLLNPAILFNCVWWGQIDTLLMMMLLLAFFLLEKDHPYLATVVMALSFVTKFQTGFFLPIFVAAILFRYPLKKTLLCGVMGAAICYTIFVPFMIAYGGPLLPVKLYTGSYGSYPYVTLYAYNVYGVFGLNWFDQTKPIFPALPWLTYVLFGKVMTYIALLSPFFVFALTKLRKVKTDVWVMSVLVMQTIFMLATMMHERYQIVVLPLLLVLFLKYRDKRWLYIFGGISAILSISEFHVMMLYNNTTKEWWSGVGGNTMQMIFSAFNVFIYLFSTWLCMKYLFGKGANENNKPVGGTPDEVEPTVAENRAE